MSPAFIIVFVLLLIFSIYIGFLVGQHLGENATSSRQWWALNAAAVGVCVLLTAVLTLIPLLAAVPLGLLGGCLAGLKMGFGESVGPWSWVDRFFNVNRGHRESTTSGTGAARRKRRRTGAPEPDLMSVDTQGEATGGSRSASSTPRRKR